MAFRLGRTASFLPIIPRVFNPISTAKCAQQTYLPHSSVNLNIKSINRQTRGLAGGVEWHGTTILCVRKDGKVVMAGDGQVSMGSSVVKGNAKKVRRLRDNILVGFAGSTADALTLLERLEKKLEEHPGQLMRACVELAKSWRTDKYLRRLEAVLLVADANHIFELTGNGDVLEPERGVMGKKL